ncbi:MAG: D-2-hydroxyacid dehydrogenase family protein [Pseudorhodoplanes sp.]
MKHRCAILDDYQNVSLDFGDWSKLIGLIDLRIFNNHIGSQDELVRALQGFHIVCLMRERTPLPRAVIERLPDLKLVCTTGWANAAVDAAALRERGITFCHTRMIGDPTADLTFALILELARRAGTENARMKAGDRQWQTRLGFGLEDKTLGVIGLGKLGTHVAQIGKAFRMRVVAWSQNLTAERCAAAGVQYVSKEALLRQSDIVTLHLRLSERTHNIIAAPDLAQMKPTAYIVNTSRGPLIDEQALIAALTDKKIAGAALDVYDREPLPADHPFRKLDNAVTTPHLGYVTAENYRIMFSDIVDNIRGFIDGNPVRVIAPTG